MEYGREIGRHVERRRRSRKGGRQVDGKQQGVKLRVVGRLRRKKETKRTNKEGINNKGGWARGAWRRKGEGRKLGKR